MDVSASSRGIIYIVTGRKFVDEACRSAASVKRCMPDIPITIFSDISFSFEHFDRIVIIDNPSCGLENKIIQMKKSPYQETLFLDSDTYMADDSRELFLLLKKFDLAAVHAPFRAQYHVNEVPDCFPEFNTGVLLFRKSEQMESFFERWGRIYAEDGVKPLNWLLPDGTDLYRHSIPNQPSFRRALYESGLKIATLPPEYNCRLPFPGILHTKVKILHGRVHSFIKTTGVLNKTHLPRVHLMRWGRIRVFDSAMPAEETILERTRWSLHHRGLLQTAVTTMTQGLTKLWKIFA